ncbi:arachidonate 5-lipoxygenase-like [Asterias rubens]|uniref:arachidonate 5-lipoxygenase-like n=1 Tax=Asterias rubens TaxID=7604 RepID=UPI001455BECB|nr:arachidonate 5-lipoxygenase-like [Asterias rubens]
MGNNVAAKLRSIFLSDYVIIVKTGDVKGAGTNANVFIALYNDVGVMSRSIPLDCRWKDDLESGRVDEFPVSNLADFGRVEKIELWRDSSGLKDDWFVESLAVDDEMLKPVMEDISIQDAMDSKKLFIVNYKILKDLPTSSGRKICAPIALFFVNHNKDLMPVAIQLHQDPSADNPVFLPTDPEYTWLLAKMWFNNADACYHQSATHLGFTHLIMESVAVATHQSLSPSHPIFRLLAPHFLYVIAINSLALMQLVSKGGWVDQSLTVGRIGMFAIIARAAPKWRLDVDGTLPADLRSRGVDDPEVLPKYYFRDDAILLYEAIRKYVTEVVDGHYDTLEKLLVDDEIQDFAEILSRSQGEGDCGIKGVHGNGKFATNAELIGALTAIIYTSSVAHAAANFSQYDEYAFPPNYPSQMRDCEPPKDKV